MASKDKHKKILIVDGYNVIRQNRELEKLFNNNMEDARHALVEMLSDYRGYKNGEIIIVFDAQYTNKKARSMSTLSNINVVFTKRLETADEYIESFVSSIENRKLVTVATDDNMVEVLVTAKGCLHISSDLLFANIDLEKQEKKSYRRDDRALSSRNTLESMLDEKTRAWMEENRRK